MNIGKFFGSAVGTAVNTANPVTAIATSVSSILDRVLPDKAANDAAKAALAQLQASGELQQILGQINIDTAEANSGNKFAADWRPMFGYCCAFSFAYNFLLFPMFTTLMITFRPAFDVSKLPHLDMSTLMTISLAMLGIGGIKQWGESK